MSRSRSSAPAVSIRDAPRGSVPAESKLAAASLADATKATEECIRVVARFRPIELQDSHLRYLPVLVDGRRYLEQQANGDFRVTTKSGVAYRLSPNMTDREADRKGPAYNELVKGDLSNGWLKVLIGNIPKESENIEFGEDACSCGIVLDSRKKIFNFHRVFQPMAVQQDLYDGVAQPIVAGVLNGFNGCIMAYGQTGSGKTHTMFGPDGAQALMDGNFDYNELGIVPRTLLELQGRAQASNDAVQLRVSYLEIYQEKIFDLLSSTGYKELADKMTQDRDRGLCLRDAMDLPVHTAKEAMDLLRLGSQRRAVAATEMNRDSSRSHALFIITVYNNEGVRRVGQLYLVDLAGSERISKSRVAGQQLAEAKQINLSLHALGLVIQHLAEKQHHVPFRASKLTRLLQNCLGGNSNTAMVINASSDPSNLDETLGSLQFGARASKIENVPKMNVQIDPEELKRQLKEAQEEAIELKNACRRLQNENARLRRGDGVALASGNALGSVTALESDGSESEQTPVDCKHGAGQNGASLPARQPDSSSSSDEEQEVDLIQLAAQRLVVRGLLPSLLCPLGHEVMHDPVFAMDGYTYCRHKMEKHIATAGTFPASSPMTGRWLTSKVLVPNMVLLQQVRHYKKYLPPPRFQVSLFARVGMYQLEHIFSFLPGLSLARDCLPVNVDFLAVASQPRLWATLLVAEFGVATTDNVGDPRAVYRQKTLKAVAAKPGARATPSLATPVRGLQLFAPERRTTKRVSARS